MAGLNGEKIQEFCTIRVWHQNRELDFGKFEINRTLAEMKMCYISLDVTKLNQFQSQHIRGTLPIKEAKVDEVRNKRNYWFAKLYAQNQSSFARKTLSMDIQQVHKIRRPK